MAAKKSTTAKPIDDSTEVDLPTAEEEREAQAQSDELLAELTMLRPPHELRLASRNKIKTIRLDYGRKLVDILGEVKSGTPLSDLDDDVAAEYMKLMMTVQESVDEFAESIAIDKKAYIAWSNANADDFAPFVAILFRYAEAVGESKRSAS